MNSPGKGHVEEAVAAEVVVAGEREQVRRVRGKGSGEGREQESQDTAEEEEARLRQRESLQLEDTQSLGNLHLHQGTVHPVLPEVLVESATHNTAPS